MLPALAPSSRRSHSGVVVRRGLRGTPPAGAEWRVMSSGAVRRCCVRLRDVEKRGMAAMLGVAVTRKGPDSSRCDTFQNAHVLNRHRKRKMKVS